MSAEVEVNPRRKKNPKLTGEHQGEVIWGMVEQMKHLIEKAHEDLHKTSALLKKRANHLEAQLIRKDTELKKKIEHLRLMKLDLERTEKERDDSLSLTKPQAKKIDDLEFALKRTEEYRKAAEDQVRRQEATIEQHEKTIEARDTTIREMEHAAGGYRKTIKTMKGEFKESEDRRYELETACVAMRNLTKTLQARLDQSKLDLKETRASVDKLNATVTELREGLEEKQTALTGALDTLEQRDRELAETKSALAETREDLAAAFKKIANHEHYIQDLEEKKAMLQKSSDSALTGLDKARAQLARTEADRVAAEKTIADRDNTIQTLMASKKAADTATERLQMTYENEVQSRKTFEKLLGQTREQLDMCQNELDECEKQLTVQKQAVSKMRRNLNM